MQLNDEPQTYYDILELTADATPQEIRSAYLRLKSSYGKDNIANYSIYSREESEQLLEKIEEAYLILANPERRKAYDLNHQGQLGNIDIPIPVMPSIHTEHAEAPIKSFSSSPITAKQPEQSIVDSLMGSTPNENLEWTGQDIRNARESKRISLEDLSDYTRISKAYLMAIEEESYEKLPAIVYVRGFLQQISRRLKLPSEQLIQKYIDRLKARRPEK
jgi:curved DNA-binding protein CbpA